MMRRTTIALLALLCAAPAASEIVVLTGGGFLKASAYEVVGERVRVTLAWGGELHLPLTRVERIVADEIEQDPDPVGGPGAAAVRIAHNPRDPAPAVPYGREMLSVASDFGVNVELLAAIARAESAFDPAAVSPKGARGLMQVMPATGRRFGARPSELFDPVANLEAAARYLAWLRRRFSDDLDLILAAYNAGEATVARYGGVPPYRETRNYIRRVRSYLSPRSGTQDAVLR